MKTFADYGIEIPSGASGEIDTTCPECSQTRKKKNARCLSVNIDKGVWCCAHCGWTGGIGKDSHRSELHWRKPEFRKPEPRPRANLPQKALTWFQSRGITEPVLIRNQVSFASVYMPQIEDHAPAIMFPYKRNGELINAKYRDAQKNFRMEAGAERVLYGLDDMRDTVVFVEGEIDKLSVEEAGIISCVSVPDGAPTPNTKDYASKFAFLETAKDQLAAVKTFVIAVDNDDPGQRLEDELSRRLGRERCKKVTWPAGCKDANEVLVKHGPAMLRECIDNATPYPIAGVFDVLELSDKIDQLYNKGFERGHKTGWAALDEFYTVRPGEMTIVTGIPNSGKSNWMDALLVNLSAIHGWRFALFSPENQPLEDHASRIIEKWARQPFAPGPTPKMSGETLRQGKEWAQAHFTWILPDDDSEWTVDTVLDRARQLVFRLGVRGLVIDPWNELEHARPDGMSETDHTSKALKRIRQFARHNGIHIWVVAHPTKLYKNKDGEYPVPTPYDISGSAHWRNKADNCLTVWRDFHNPEAVVEIHVQKIRFRQIGRLGKADLYYHKVTGTYSDRVVQEPARAYVDI